MLRYSEAYQVLANPPMRVCATYEGSPPSTSRGRWEILERRSLASRDVGFWTRTREVQQGQDAPAVPDVLGGTWPQSVPAVTVPGRVPRCSGHVCEHRPPVKSGTSCPCWERATATLRVEPNSGRSSRLCCGVPAGARLRR